jgi:hypothetical protein
MLTVDFHLFDLISSFGQFRVRTSRGHYHDHSNVLLLGRFHRRPDAPGCMCSLHDVRPRRHLARMGQSHQSSEKLSRPQQYQSRRQWLPPESLPVPALLPKRARLLYELIRFSPSPTVSCKASKNAADVITRDDGPLPTIFSGTIDRRSLMCREICSVPLPSLAHTNAEVLTTLLRPENQECHLANHQDQRLSPNALLEFAARLRPRISVLIDA